MYFLQSCRTQATRLSLFLLIELSPRATTARRTASCEFYNFLSCKNSGMDQHVSSSNLFRPSEYSEHLWKDHKEPERRNVVGEMVS